MLGRTAKRPMWQIELGLTGRKVAKRSLERHGFDVKEHDPPAGGFAHLSASHAGRTYWINVRTGNKYRATGDEINPYFSLTPIEQEGAKSLKSRNPRSVLACIALTIVASPADALHGEPPNSFSCFLIEYGDSVPRRIRLDEKHLNDYVRLAIDERSNDDLSSLSNRSAQ